MKKNNSYYNLAMWKIKNYLRKRWKNLIKAYLLMWLILLTLMVGWHQAFFNSPIGTTKYAMIFVTPVLISIGIFRLYQESE
ncbi:MAG TPA: hypothetical protein DIW23_05760 [Anaerolineae bacterium]|nr:hypothetical protein [Anaerolineae bacterium]